MATTTSRSHSFKTKVALGMDRLTTHSYVPVAGYDDADDRHEVRDAEQPESKHKSTQKQTFLWLLLLFVLLITLNIFLWRLFAVNVHQRQRAVTSAPETWCKMIPSLVQARPRLTLTAPTFEEPDLLATSAKKIAGAIGQKNPYHGFPSPEINQAWIRIGEAAPGIRLSANEVGRLNKSTEHLHQVQNTDVDSEFQYLGMLEVFHLLHCLDAVRSIAYRELYREEVTFPPITDLEAHRIHLGTFSLLPSLLTTQ